MAQQGRYAELFELRAEAIASAMKIATFNVNNVNRRLPNLLAWLKRARPDIVCLQELKAADDAFPAAELRRAGYRAGRGRRPGMASPSSGARPNRS